MKKEEFTDIYQRWLESGLSIKDFCENEAYGNSSFYYWKSKFGISSNTSLKHPVASSADFAPVKLEHHKSMEATLPVNHLVIELPNRIKIHFNDTSDYNGTLHLLTKICGNDVLSE